ncbi:hypothetical protein DPMN_008736 [Dreissena polymorpha]|uniref:Uncharacterized protein n=1 Tax=Dreissena polymorpha TaxID=45954 RepID=A0A9D4MZX2_DREPO|nr:hypothetical protein DPMN_008735 [Dreissena polymorpha]KAH3884750.1 hypothetical protein DPMN_008736 [Dreissena polymorpha]
MLKLNFGWAWSMWAGRPWLRLTYQLEVNRCRNEEDIVARIDGQTAEITTLSPRSNLEQDGYKSMGTKIIDRVVIRDSMWAGRPMFGYEAMHNVQYQLEVNRCRNEEFYGSSANSVGGVSVQDGRTERGDQNNIPTLLKVSPGFQKSLMY